MALLKMSLFHFYMWSIVCLGVNYESIRMDIINIKNLKCTVLPSSSFPCCFQKAKAIIIPELLYVPPFFPLDGLLFILFFFFLNSSRHLVVGLFNLETYPSEVGSFLVFSFGTAVSQIMALLIFLFFHLFSPIGYPFVFLIFHSSVEF